MYTPLSDKVDRKCSVQPGAPPPAAKTLSRPNASPAVGRSTPGLQGPDLDDEESEETRDREESNGREWGEPAEGAGPEGVGFVEERDERGSSVRLASHNKLGFLSGGSGRLNCRGEISAATLVYLVYLLAALR